MMHPTAEQIRNVLNRARCRCGHEFCEHSDTLPLDVRTGRGILACDHACLRCECVQFKDEHRKEIEPCACDLSLGSLQNAADQLQSRPTSLHVHAYDLSLGRYLIQALGWRGVAVTLREDYQSDEWSLFSLTSEVHSEGA